MENFNDFITTLSDKYNVKIFDSEILSKPLVQNRFWTMFLKTNGYFEEQKSTLEFRYSKNPDILNLNLVDFLNVDDNNKLIYTSVKGIDTYVIIYLCEFNEIFANSDDFLIKEITDPIFKIGYDYKRIIHIYFSLTKYKNLRENLHSKLLEDKYYENQDLIYIQDKHNKNVVFGHWKKGEYKNNTKDKPLISVIMPTFNSENLIEQSIQSVIFQTYPNYELIIIDGLSKDRTLKILKKYENYIDAVISEDDNNIFDAINKGTYLSRGLYSVFIGSDDLLLPNSLESVIYKLIDNNNGDYFYGDGIILRKNNKLSYINCFIKSGKFGNFNLLHTSLYITKKVFKELNGFDINYHINADFDFELRLISKNKTSIKIYKYLSIFREGGFSSIAQNKLKQTFNILKKHKRLNLNFYIFVIKYFTFRIIKNIISDRLFLYLRSIKENIIKR